MQEKWWLPKDGVRAYVAILAFTAATIFAGWEAYHTLKTPEWYIGAVATIIGFYFMASKSGE